MPCNYVSSSRMFFGVLYSARLLRTFLVSFCCPIVRAMQMTGPYILSMLWDAAPKAGRRWQKQVKSVGLDRQEVSVNYMHDVCFEPCPLLP